jgi:hypothetical protein
MRYLGSRMFKKCSDGQHELCPNYDIDSEERLEYVDCRCPCHHAIEAAAWDEERDRVAERKSEFIAAVEQVFGHKIGGGHAV